MNESISQALAPLDPNERRILGVLVEKAKTTPEYYPLTANAIITGANQKSNRDPVMTLDEDDAQEALENLQKRQLVSKVTGSRVDRWRHHLYEVWQVSKVEMAILAELLLRGAQTEGELRGRAGRMEPIDDLETLRQTLKPMAERGLVVVNGELGRRGTLITHGFNEPGELTSFRARVISSEDRPSDVGFAAPDRFPAPDRFAKLEADLIAALADIAQLRQEVTELRRLVEKTPNAGNV